MSVMRSLGFGRNSEALLAVSDALQGSSRRISHHSYKMIGYRLNENTRYSCGIVHASDRLSTSAALVRFDWG
ncbi:hypothetical protein FOMPIDRAFT_161966 [Fomitopsis schrenkii]|uniref:Uncharacterized protein n=1 Tax=Fomitopsis schrenkii TaxID=2126942 RepID=S8DMF4_FOMSC|nr:hypothetical protein FOMPIDRAFT_161966 [Fomitopsis schrenkii]